MVGQRTSCSISPLSPEATRQHSTRATGGVRAQGEEVFQGAGCETLCLEGLRNWLVQLGHLCASSFLWWPFASTHYCPVSSPAPSISGVTDPCTQSCGPRCRDPDAPCGIWQHGPQQSMTARATRTLGKFYFLPKPLLVTLHINTLRQLRLLALFNIDTYAVTTIKKKTNHPP